MLNILFIISDRECVLNFTWIHLYSQQRLRWDLNWLRLAKQCIVHIWIGPFESCVICQKETWKENNVRRHQLAIMYGMTHCECLTLSRVIWWIINAQHTGWSLGDSSSSKWKKNSYCTVETTALACLSFSSLAQRQREKTKKKKDFLQSLFLSLPLPSGVKKKESFVWFSLFLAGVRGQTLPGSHRETAHAVWSCNADNTAQPEISLSCAQWWSLREDPTMLIQGSVLRTILSLSWISAPAQSMTMSPHICTSEQKQQSLTESVCLANTIVWNFGISASPKHSSVFF